MATLISRFLFLLNIFAVAANESGEILVIGKYGSDRVVEALKAFELTGAVRKSVFPVEDGYESGSDAIQRFYCITE